MLKPLEYFCSAGLACWFRLALDDDTNLIEGACKARTRPKLCLGVAMLGNAGESARELRYDGRKLWVRYQYALPVLVAIVSIADYLSQS